jgi:hypothetical protein
VFEARSPGVIDIAPCHIDAHKVLLPEIVLPLSNRPTSSSGAPTTCQSLQDGKDVKVADAGYVREIGELWRKIGDGVNQAADLISATASIPSLNFIPLTTFGNWF